MSGAQGFYWIFLDDAFTIIPEGYEPLPVLPDLAVKHTDADQSLVD
jgi:hypothetical protein